MKGLRLNRGSKSSMLIGILCAFGAGLMWGLVFIAPLLLPDYPGIVLSLGRYIAFGLIALIPAYLDRVRIGELSRADWHTAFKLSLVGNLLYYGALASAIQLADAPLPTMLIGTLPVAIAIYANLKPGHPSEAIPWVRLAAPLLLLLLGLLLVNAAEIYRMDRSSPATRSIEDYVLGCVIALGALAAWTWYPVMNGRHLKANPGIGSSTWATAQGLASLPLALAGFACYAGLAKASVVTFVLPLGARPGLFVVAMLAIGLGASWLGTLLWNQASQRLPTALAGQLIVFETLSALAYAFILRESLPTMPVTIGIIVLCAGVMLGVRAFR